MGSGPPLVLLHGVCHRRQAWYPVLELLAAHREVIAVDLPGHGESDPLPDDGRWVVDALQDAMLEFFDQQGLVKPHVAGNSLGGRIALELAAIGRAASVTALAPAGFWRSARAFSYTKGVFGAAQTLSVALGPAAPVLSMSALGRALMYGWIVAKPANLSSARALGDFRAFHTAAPMLRELLKAATPFAGHIPDDVEVTIAWGTRDAVLPSYQAKVARAALPNAHHVTLPGCGHVPMSDDPRLIADVLLAGSALTTSVPTAFDLVS
ncbi:MAG: alpha/beta fold hydrolase [Sciscionella sp.]|nr:alpha/beta fold hydrolase [Sciscionella sp.]